MVLFGTGKFINDADKVDTSTQTLYGIWDYGDSDDPSEYVGIFNAETGTLVSPRSNVELVEQTVTKTGDTGKISNNQMHWYTVNDENDENGLPDPGGNGTTEASLGWYLNLGTLANGERLIHDVAVRGGNAIFVTLAPDNSPCSGGGVSALYELDACSGGVTRNPVFPPYEDEDWPNVIYKPFIMYPPKIIQLPEDDTGPNEEEKLISTSQGTIIRQEERAPTRGFSYWKEW
jgi:type IV pilus assembly protein PilY1